MKKNSINIKCFLCWLWGKHYNPIKFMIGSWTYSQNQDICMHRVCINPKYLKNEKKSTKDLGINS